MLSRLLGSSIVSRLLQLENILLLIDFNPFGNSIFVKLVQCSRAFIPILIILSGKFILVKAPQPLKA